MNRPLPDWFAVLGVVLAAVICATGVAWALTHGGQDFGVFYAAGRTVLEGHAAQVYHLTPDRFLYAPGFAWLMAPLALFPQEIALAIFSFFKVGLLGLVVAMFRDLARSQGTDALTAWGIAGWSVVFIARPLLIDFQYGQVNLFFLCLALFAVSALFDRRKSLSVKSLGLKWFFLALAAAAKLILLPLLVLPFWVLIGSAKRLRMARVGVICGIVFVFILPFTLKGIPQWFELHGDWLQAIRDRGFPRESHNQSFLAVLYHLFGGDPTHVLGLYAQRDFNLRGWNGAALLNKEVLPYLGWAWSLIWGALILGNLAAARRWMERHQGNPMGLLGEWSWLIAILILPSHLVWKPYFIFALPLLFFVIWSAWRHRRPSLWIALGTYVVLSQFMSKDVLGPENSAWFEAAGAMLWAYLIVVAVGAQRNSWLRRAHRLQAVS